MYSENSQRSINQFLSKRTFEHDGYFLFEDTNALFEFKIKLSGTKKMISVGDYYDYVIVDATIVDADERVKQILAIFGKMWDKEKIENFLFKDYRWKNGFIRTITELLEYFSDDNVRVHMNYLQISDELYNEIESLKKTLYEKD